MILSQLNTLRLRPIRNKVLIFNHTIKQLHLTLKETSHKRHVSNSINKKFNLRSCSPQGASTYAGSSLIEVLLLFVIVNIMLNLSLGLLLLVSENDIPMNDIKEGCDIECVIKMDLP